MKRDARLHGLTSDHHHALRLAFDIRQAASRGGPTAQLLARAREAFARELDPHFAIEERVLLPALDAAGESALAERTRQEHAALRADLAAAESGDLTRLVDFGARLAAHVRFEEGELFPVCEAKVPATVLEEVLRLAPKHRSRYTA